MTQLPTLNLPLLAAGASAVGAAKYRERIRREEREDEELALRRRQQNIQLASERERLRLARQQAKATRSLANRQQRLRELQAVAQFGDTVADNQRQAAQLDFYNRQLAAREEASAFESGVTLSQAIAERQRLGMNKHLSPEGKRLHGELTGKLRSLNRARGIIRPGEYNRLLQQWVNDYDAAGVQNLIDEPPSPKQQWAESAVQVSPGYFVSPDGKGGWREFDTRESLASNNHRTTMTLAEYMRSPKAQKAARERLADRYFRAHPDLKGEYEPPPQEVDQEQASHYERWQGFLRQLQNPDVSEVALVVEPDAASNHKVDTSLNQPAPKEIHHFPATVADAVVGVTYAAAGRQYRYLGEGQYEELAAPAAPAAPSGHGD